MSKVKMFAMIFVCGICCLWSFNNSWAKDHKVTVDNKLAQTGHANNVDSSCYPVTLAVHSSVPVKTFTLTNPLKANGSDTFNIEVSHCNRMQIEAKCHWYRQNTTGIGGLWLDTSAASNFDCVSSGTAKIEIENGQLRVKAP